MDQRIGQNGMDARTEKAYQERVAELESQNAHLESRLVDLTHQLAQRDTVIAELRVQVAQSDATIAALQQQVAALSKQVAELLAQVARLSKNSSNSSKPPSSDIVKPPLPPLPPGEKRVIGGQKGHPRHQREPFTPEQINLVVDYQMARCPDCGGVVHPAALPPRKLQQVEIPEVPVEVLEHRSHACFCRHCQKTYYAPLPADVQKSGLVGPRLTAWVAYLKGPCHCSFSTIRKFCRDVLHLPISRGQLAKVIQKVSGAMAQSHEDLLEMLPNQAVLNVDETGHKTNGRRHWTWCFRAASFICFKIDHSRGSQVLREVLGEAFAGTLGCDYFSAYHKYGKDFEAAMQFCLAHLIRDVKFLATLPEPAIVAYGERMLVELRHLFHIIHQRGTMAAEAFQSAMEQARDDLTAVSLDAPQYRPAQNMAKRFEQNGESYFRFITTPGLEPTNNLAEQAIRFVVLDRLVTQGTRSERGQKWCERIWTAIATCSQQQRSVFEFLYQSINNHFAGKPTPSLLPSGP